MRLRKVAGARLRKTATALVEAAGAAAVLAGVACKFTPEDAAIVGGIGALLWVLGQGRRE